MGEGKGESAVGKAGKGGGWEENIMRLCGFSHSV